MQGNFKLGFLGLLWRLGPFDFVQLGFLYLKAWSKFTCMNLANNLILAAKSNKTHCSFFVCITKTCGLQLILFFLFWFVSSVTYLNSLQEDLYYPHPLVQDILWASLHKVVEPILMHWPGKRLREKALRIVMEHIHYEDENTRYICIGPVNKVLVLNFH